MLANHAPASTDSPQGDSDYDTILAALMETARGRYFLEEYARRNRSPDTATLLSAIARIEGLLQSRRLDGSEPAAAAPSPAPANAEPAPENSDIDQTADISIAQINAVAAIEVVAITASEPERLEIPSASPTETTARDAFADIRALSDLEKIALFT